jgi:SAM-dependent methyltransferase
MEIVAICENVNARAKQLYGSSFTIRRRPSLESKMITSEIIEKHEPENRSLKKSMPASNSTTRFSDRVENYARYRPGYPPEVLQALKTECGLAGEHVIADIASGTGIWTRALLENGNAVFAVEPNAGMRAACEASLASFAKFKSIAGTAEATTLADRSIDFVTAAQAAHWFDRERSRREFARIMKPDAWLVLMWNERVTDSTAFLRDYEQLLLKYGTDYQEIRHERTTDEINQFFDPLPFTERVFDMHQHFDYAGIEGRLLSSSYAPGPEHPQHEAMLHELRGIFDAHAIEGKATFEYKTRVYFGHLS